ncbi:Hypothetical predicted protein [Podarcis lilfordi]|uniref:Uncharacterized protein n=1 Tax=Podarcis lilfordi TaxID=74358 RepID=A0AA35KEQ1_9SAUR|nr:Hypothetical predicted protein [Podarcis lilfordi]
MREAFSALSGGAARHSRPFLRFSSERLHRRVFSAASSGLKERQSREKRGIALREENFGYLPGN